MKTLASLVPAAETDLHALLADRMLPRLRATLEQAGPGQRMRVTTLPEAVMDRLCLALQGDDRWEARALTAAPSGEPWRATATKIIELRNALERPLLVFIPPGLRIAAEDSLDIATFTELSLHTMSTVLVSTLLERLPPELASVVRDELDYLRTEGVTRSADDEVEYLLTITKNGATREAAGGALYTLGLLPDFDLFTRGNTRHWLTRNRNASEILEEVDQPLQGRLRRLPLRPGTIDTKLFAFLRSRETHGFRTWTSLVATDPAFRSLALDQWEFVDSGAVGELRLILDPLDLKVPEADVLQGTTQMPVFDVSGNEALKVAFRSVPAPWQHEAWTSYRVQVLALTETGASVAWESNSFAKPQGQQQNRKVRRTIKAQDLRHLDEGTYFVKVDAYDANGGLLTTPRHIDSGAGGGRSENESAPFLLVREGVDVAPEPARATFVSSFLDAWVQAGVQALGGKAREAIPERATAKGRWSQAVGTRTKGDVHFELEGESFGGFSVVVPSLLRTVELAVLQKPEIVCSRLMSFVGVKSPEDVEPAEKEVISLPASAAQSRFLDARQAAFKAILQHHHVQGGDSAAEHRNRAGLVETSDLLAHVEAIEEYASAYVGLVRHACDDGAADRAALLRGLALLDTVELRWKHTAGDPGRAVMVAPTHPTRLLWHLRHAQACDAALTAWETGSMRSADWREHLNQLRKTLIPLSLPMVVFDRRMRGYVEHAPLTPSWPLYLPDRLDGDAPIDGAAARDRVLRELGIRHRAIAITTVSADDVASRLFEYVTQHPYVEQLRINVFNPGDGRLIADVLRKVEARRLDVSRRNPPSLRYAVQLFANAEHLDSIGEGLESLLDPDRQVGEDDEFTLGAHNHLLPKLIFARNATTEFVHEPDRFPAHVSILLEQFAVQSRVGRVDGLRRGSFLGGLVQEPETQLEHSTNQFGWTKGVNPRTRPSASAAEELMVADVVAAQRTQAGFALARAPAPEDAPIVALRLDLEGQALLRQVHAVSDWVLTIDRNLGLDYFDSPASLNDAGYLLDFAPEYLHEDRQRILLTTRSALELEALVRPTFAAYGLDFRTGDEGIVLESLRSLSGRLALRLESGRSQAAEVVGLLLARWLLDRAGLLDQRVVIPLDAHRSWFATNDLVPDRRADLLIVGLVAPRTLRMDVVEVKLREQLGPSDRTSLYAEMRDQTDRTEERLKQLFDLDPTPVPRADAPLRAKELGSALAFYVRRAVRYGLLDTEGADQLLSFADTLDEGYTLDLRSLGVVFEHKGTGSHVDEEEPHFPVFRFGGDKARQLFADAVGRQVDRAARISERTSSARPVARPSLEPERSAEAAALSDADVESFAKALSVRSARKTSSYPIRPADPRDVLPVSDSARPPRRSASLGSEADVTLPSAGITPPRAQPPHSEPTNARRDVSPPLEPPPVAAPAGAVVPTGPTPNPPVDPPTAILGSTEPTPQWGILGKSGSHKVALDLNGCNTISLFGVQGFGKSYTLGVIAEMAAAPIANINLLPSPLATVIFHYHKSDAYEPEFVTAVAPNRKVLEIERLVRDYGAQPAGLSDVVLLAPQAKVEQRRKDYPEVTVEPIKFSSAELGAESWKFLLGAYGNDSLYMKQLVAIMRKHRGNLTLDVLRQEIAAAGLSPQAQRLADDRIALAAPYIDDAQRLGDLLRPGRTVIVDLRDEWTEKDEALGLFVVMLRIFAASKHQGHDFNKLVVFDEAHKYITESELIGHVVETIREMRHQATSVVIASQDPLSVPRAIIELTSVLILHRITSPQWLKHLKGAIVALEELSDHHLTSLAPGEALVWAQRSTDKRFTLRPQKIQIRPRVTQHGGGTKTAVAGVTVR